MDCLGLGFTSHQGQDCVSCTAMLLTCLGISRAGPLVRREGQRWGPVGSRHLPVVPLIVAGRASRRTSMRSERKRFAASWQRPKGSRQSRITHREDNLAHTHDNTWSETTLQTGLSKGPRTGDSPIIHAYCLSQWMRCPHELCWERESKMESLNAVCRGYGVVHQRAAADPMAMAMLTNPCGQSNRARDHPSGK